MIWPQQPAASTVWQLFAAHKDLNIFQESQKNGPGDPWLQARDNLRMEPSLTCLEPPTLACYRNTRAAHQRGKQCRIFPVQGTILSPDNDADGLWSRTAVAKVCVKHHGPSGFLSNLALVILAHSLPAMDVSPGNQSPGMARLNEWRCTLILILINNHWPWLLD